MKRTIAVLLSIIMCIGAMAFAIPAGAETEYNLFSDATYTYTLSDGIDFWTNGCTDTGRTCLTDGAFRRTSGNVAFNDIYGVAGTTVEIGAYGTTVIEFTLASPALLEKLIIRSARRSGNRYLNIESIETAPADGSYTVATYTESAAAIEGAPKYDGADQYFDITVAFTNMLTKAAKVRITLNTYDGYEEQYILSFDEIEAYGNVTSVYNVASDIAMSGATAVQPGQPFSVDVTFSNITLPNGIVGCDLPLVYDSELIMLESVELITPTAWNSKSVNLSPADVSLNPYWLSLACDADDLLTNTAYYVKTNGVLGFRLNFVALANGEAEIKVDNDLDNGLFIMAVNAKDFKIYGANGASHTVTVSGAAVTTYKVNYDANGGSGAPNSQTKLDGSDLTMSSVVPTRAGYVFLGWAKNKDSQTADFAAGGKYTVDESVTLYAVWEEVAVPETYTISYNANGGANAPESQTKTEGVDATLSSIVPTREGFTFLGWAKSKTAQTADFAAGGKYTVDANVTLYAVWKENTAVEPETYTISYDANGGANAPEAQTKTKGVVVALSSTVPTREGYVFVGWAQSKNSAASEYNPGDNYTADADITLYAVWRAEHVDLVLGDVNFDGNINSLDAAYVLKYDAFMLTFDDAQLLVGDVNGDNTVNSLDAAQILKYDAMIIDRFPAQN